MNETDDRLVGDPVWELFTQPTAGPADVALGTGHHGPWLVGAGLIALGCYMYPPLAVVTVCLAVAAQRFPSGSATRPVDTQQGGRHVLRTVQLCLGSLEGRHERHRIDVRFDCDLDAREATG